MSSRTVSEPKPATWTLALRDEPLWRSMGCPTMGTALRRIKDLEARVLRLTLEAERADETRESNRLRRLEKKTT